MIYSIEDYHYFPFICNYFDTMYSILFLISIIYNIINIYSTPGTIIVI